MKNNLKRLLAELSFFTAIFLKVLYLLPLGSRWLKFLRTLRMYFHPVSVPILKTFKYKDLTLTANISETIGGNFFYGLKDPEADICASLVKEGDVCVDVGANLGIYALKMAKKANKLYAFEPCDELLSVNLKDNSAANVINYTTALGDENIDDKEFYISQESGFSGFSARDGIKGIKKVVCRTLDGLKLGKIDFIKIDTEGYDGRIIAGAWDTIKKYKPIIFAELVDRSLSKFGDQRAEIIKKLIDLDYRAFIIDRSDWQLKSIAEANLSKGINFVFKT